MTPLHSQLSVDMTVLTVFHSDRRKFERIRTQTIEFVVGITNVLRIYSINSINFITD